MVRTLLASAALAAAVALSGCDTDGTTMPSGRALAPLSDKMQSEIETKNMSKESPILVRLFKEEAELEVWKQDRSGRFTLLKTYPICRWSGELGPKIKEGDRQAPEGFYAITPGQMNPNSSYYLSFNLGYPNAFDRAYGRTGAHLMVHGDCSSAGCYAMTDEQIQEIYALARESFFGGQRSFQVQAYPFRMTALNMARHRTNPNYAFWTMLKVGNDHFEVTRQQPKVDVCEKRYVFNAFNPSNPTADLHFNATAACPAYSVPADVASAVRQKQATDNVKITELIRRGTRQAPIRTGTDGGMNPVFASAIKGGDVFDSDGRLITASAVPAKYGTIPKNIRLPRNVDPNTPAPAFASSVPATTGSVAVAADVPLPRANPRGQSRTAVAQAPASSGGIGGFFKGFFGGSNSEPAQPTTRVAAAPPAATPADTVSSSRARRAAPAPVATRSAPPPAPAPRPAAKPQSAPKAKAAAPAPTASAFSDPARPKAADAAKPAPGVRTADNAKAAESNVMSGAQPVVPTGSFENRFGAWR
jgi:murein L,D-transpeptidase YafK